MLDINTTHLMNCIDGMQQLDGESVDLVVTSPPYDDLRTYNDSSQWDHNVFMQVADNITRVLKPGGVIMWNVNDATVKGSETGSSFRQCLYFMDACGMRLHDTMIYEKTGTAFASGPNSVRYTQIFEYCFILSKGNLRLSTSFKTRRMLGQGILHLAMLALGRRMGLSTILVKRAKRSGNGVLGLTFGRSRIVEGLDNHLRHLTSILPLCLRN